MQFNCSTQNDFQPEMSISDEKLECVKQMKLLGVIITDDLRWHKNTEFITKKAATRLWVLRRLKKLGASKNTLVDIFYKQIRSVLEYAAVVWTAGLTQENIATIERVQKSACCIILGSNYVSYEAALTELNMKSLAERRQILCLKFAKKASQHPDHRRWFVENTQTYDTRIKKQPYKPVCTRTARFMKSAIPYLTSLLNK